MLITLSRSKVYLHTHFLERVRVIPLAGKYGWFVPPCAFLTETIRVFLIRGPGCHVTALPLTTSASSASMASPALYKPVKGVPPLPTLPPTFYRRAAYPEGNATSVASWLSMRRKYQQSVVDVNFYTQISSAATNDYK